MAPSSQMSWERREPLHPGSIHPGEGGGGRWLLASTFPHCSDPSPFTPHTPGCMGGAPGQPSGEPPRPAAWHITRVLKRWKEPNSLRMCWPAPNPVPGTSPARGHKHRTGGEAPAFTATREAALSLTFLLCCRAKTQHHPGHSPHLLPTLWKLPRPSRHPAHITMRSPSRTSGSSQPTELINLSDVSFHQTCVCTCVCVI